MDLHADTTQYEPEADSDEEDSDLDDALDDMDDEDEFEAGSSSGKRRSLGEGPRSPGKRRRLDDDVSTSQSVYYTMLSLPRLVNRDHVGYREMSERGICYD